MGRRFTNGVIHMALNLLCLILTVKKGGREGQERGKFCFIRELQTKESKV